MRRGLVTKCISKAFLRRQRQALQGFYEGNDMISPVFWKDHSGCSMEVEWTGAKLRQEEWLGGADDASVAWAGVVTVKAKKGGPVRNNPGVEVAEWDD